MRNLAIHSTTLVLVAILFSSVALAGAELEERCRLEIVELHKFLEDWFNAALPSTDEAFARFAEAIDPSFHIVGPDGVIADRETIVEAVRSSHGRWSEAPGTIRIEGFRLRQTSDGLALATYEEWHELEETKGRVSSVLFGADEAGPNGLAWLHLHEVWIGPD